VFVDRRPAPAAGRLRYPLAEAFVAHPYSYNSRGYWDVLRAQQDEFYVKFRYADDTPHAAHIAEKVRGLILRAKLSIFDLAGWNPDVALEYGIAVGMNLRASRIWILLNTTESEDVPSDLRGFAQNRYDSMEDLAQKLPAWMGTSFRRRAPTE
jgi:hypothetical protein